MNRGDIVTLANRSGLWIFAGDSPAEIPSRAIGKFLRATHIDSANPHEALSIGIHSATLVTSPSFTPGETVAYQGESAGVESDDGDTVVLTFTRHPQVTRYADEHFSQDWKVSADRAQLVRTNIEKFI
jgi:hypothetical protein